MTSELIGGHEGYDVHRVPADPALCLADTMIVHVAKDEHNAASLDNEERSLRAMAGTGLAPEWLVTRTFGEGTLDGLVEVYETDLGISDPVYEDGEVLRHACVRLLAAIRSRGLRHGDLSSVNLIMRDGGSWVGAVDWQESHPLGEPAPQKSPFTDSTMLMNFLKGHLDTRGIADTPRVARRWQAVLGDLGATAHHDENPLPLAGQTFLDLGCFQGDFPALAACEGMRATGIDMGGFRTGENSVEIGNARWQALPWDQIGGAFGLGQAELFQVAPDADVAMCFSTWAWMLQQRSKEECQDWLRKAIDYPGVLYFETQLAGDGPGPEWLPTDEAVEELLRSLGGQDVKPIITIPVTGRPANRTVWAVR